MVRERKNAFQAPHIGSSLWRRTRVHERTASRRGAESYSGTCIPAPGKLSAGRDLMPTVAFDLFELDACGVSAAEMTTDVVQNNGVLSDTVKTMRAITKRLLTSDCTSTTRRPAQAAVGRWWRWRTGRSGKAPKGPWWRPTAAPRSPPPSAFAIREIGVAAT